MPIQNTDLMVVQQGTTPYKVSTQTLKTYFQTGVTLNPATAAVLGGIKVGTNLSVKADGTLSANITGALTYKGVKNFTAAPGVTPAVGHLYINNKAGTVDAGWTGLAGQTAVVGEMALWDGTKWDLVGVGSATGTVTAVIADSPLSVTNTNPAQPHLSISPALPSKNGTGGAPGVMTAVMLEKLNGIASGAQPGTVTNVTGTAPVHVATGTKTPVISIDAASTTANGVVQLADAAALAAGNHDRVVTADQLKATNDAVATATAGGLSNIVGTAPIKVTGTGASRTVAIDPCSTTAVGAVQLATGAETAFSVAAPVGTKAVTPAGLKANYMPLDISLLTLLP
jgi:hypothetical protein